MNNRIIFLKCMFYLYNIRRNDILKIDGIPFFSINNINDYFSPTLPTCNVRVLVAFPNNLGGSIYLCFKPITHKLYYGNILYIKRIQKKGLLVCNLYRRFL